MERLIILSMSIVALTSLNAYAIDANLTFTGAVNVSTCTLEASDATKTVVMPDVSATRLNLYTDSWVGTTTYLHFINCPDTVTQINIPKVTTPGRLWNNTSAGPSSGTAKNIILQLNSGSPGDKMTGAFRFDGVSNGYFLVYPGRTTIPLTITIASARFIAPAAVAQAGSYSSSFTMTFSWT